MNTMNDDICPFKVGDNVRYDTSNQGNIKYWEQQRLGYKICMDDVHVVTHTKRQGASLFLIRVQGCSDYIYSARFHKTIKPVQLPEDLFTL